MDKVNLSIWTTCSYEKSTVCFSVFVIQGDHQHQNIFLLVNFLGDGKSGRNFGLNIGQNIGKSGQNIVWICAR